MEKPMEPNYTDLHPTYQIDFSAEDVGKRFAASKREIRWRFGFPNQQALNAGVTGPACRGEEHEVVVLWSITSGKKVVILNKQEIHNSTGRVNTFYHSFIVRGRHVVKLEANLTKHENLPQYDLQIDGVSFSSMPKVFQLGIRGATPNENVRQGPSYVPERTERYAPPPAGRQYDYNRGQYVQPPMNSQQEEDDLRQAIARSLEDSRNHLAAKGKDGPPRVEAPPTSAPKQPDLLIDFFSDPIPTNSQPVQQPVAPSYNSNQVDLFSAPPSATPVYNDPFSTNYSSASTNATSNHASTSSVTTVAENPFAVPATAPNTYASPAPYNIHGSNPFAQSPFSPAPAQNHQNMNGGYSNYQQPAPSVAAYNNGYPHQGQAPVTSSVHQPYGYGYQATNPGAIQGYSAPGQQSQQQYGNYQF